MSWDNIPGWTDGHLHAIYDQAIEEAKDGDVLVEIGVAFGRSLGYLATKALEAGKRPRIVAVDSFLPFEWKEPHLNERVRVAGSPMQACIDCLRTELPPEASELYMLVGEESSIAAPMLKDGEATFIFIDGWHDEASVARDIKAWLPKLARGGVMAGHDFDPGYPGVEVAVRKAFGNDFEQRGSCWWRRAS